MRPAPADPNPLISLLRNCVVRVDDGEGGFLGTGFFVAPGVVASCAHVVHGATGVRVTWQGEEAAATVIAALPPLDQVPDPRAYPMPDLATVAVGDAFAGHPCVHVGLGPALGQPLYVAGYTIEHAKGQVALTGACTAFESPITENGTTFYKLSHGQVLPGFSGAPVLDLRSGEVCGIAESTRDRRTDLGGFAIPSPALTAAFRAVAAAHGTFHAADHRWRDAVEAERSAGLERGRRRPRLPLAAPMVSFEWSDESSPADALRARHAVVPFVGRAALRRGIEAWCERGDGEGDDVGVWFVTGGGGFGKTRLAVEACAQAEARGWTAGLLHADLPDAKLAELGAWPGPLLVAVDYAETRPAVVRRLVEEFASQAPRPPVRLLLLVRRRLSRADLLAMFNGEREEALAGLLGRASVSVLEEAGGDVDRLVLYDEGRSAYARLVGPVPAGEARPQLRASHFARPLFVLVAAFLRATDRDLDVDALPELDLLRRWISEHETNYWARSAQGDGLALDPLDQRVAVALATLLTAADEEEALSVVGLVPNIGDDPARRVAVARWLARTYGELGAGATLRLGPLEPDRLGEVLVADVLRERPGLLEQTIDQAAPGQLVRAVTVASRIAVVDGDVRDQLRTALDPRLAGLFDAAFAGDTELLTALLAAVEVCSPLTGALAVAEQLPDDVPVWARPIAVTLTELAVDGLRVRADGDPGQDGVLAGWLNNLAIRLSDVGRRDEALAVTTEAVELYRELAGANPVPFLPNLAASLNTLASRLIAVGRRAHALAVATDAVGLYRELAGAEPAFLPNLATSLNNLAIVLSSVGRREDALAVASEAVELYRELAGANRAAFLPDLAMSLNTLANRLSNVGGREDALAVASEAVELYRELAAADLATFLPNLGTSLDNLASRLSGVGRRAEALAVASEAVELHRELAGENPAAFLPDLAGSLNNLAIVLSDVGRRAEALAVATEAVELYRELAGADLAAFLADLAGSLDNLANRLSDVGRRAEALAVATEAVELYRELAGADLAAFLADLAGSLNNLANCLSEMGRREDALVVATEAVELRRELAGTNPAAFLADLARSLNNLANRLSAVGRREDALAVATEAVERCRELAGASPGAFLADLAGSLNNLANRLSDVGRRAEALAVATEAVELYRELAGASPAAFLPDVGMSLNNLAIRLSDVGRSAEALAMASEAVDLRRELAEANPDAFLPDLVTSLSNLAVRLVEDGRPVDAEAQWTGVLDRFGDTPTGRRHVLLGRGRWRAAHDLVAGAIADLVDAIAGFEAAGDVGLRSEARMSLRGMREADATGFDTSWPASRDLPLWLAHPEADEHLAHALVAWIDTPDWEASEVYLHEHAATLLTETGEAQLEHLVDANPSLPTVSEHLDLLQAARSVGARAAYQAHAERRRADRLLHMLADWIDTPTWAASRAFAAEHLDDLCTEECRSLLDSLVAVSPRDAKLRLHRGLLALATAEGIDAAYALLEPAARKVAIDAEAPRGATDRVLALARLDSGLVPDGAEAHFRLATVTLLRGDTDEAAAAIADCCDHAAPFERADFARRLDRLAGDHPEVAALVAELRALLEH